MARIGNFFRKIGGGIKKAAVWTSKNIVRPAVKHINQNFLVGAALDTLGPVGTAIKLGARAAGAAYHLYDNRKQIKEASSEGGVGRGITKAVDLVADA
jgi:hypothetical protein